MMNKPINHNDPIARLRAALPEQFGEQYATIEALRTKFVRTERDGHLAEQMNLLINNAVQCRDSNLPPSLDNRIEGKGLVLYGSTGAGKTTSLRDFFRNHPVFAGYRDPASVSPLLWLSAPSPCTIIQLGRKILIASGYPLERDLPAHRLFEIVGQRLNAMGKIVLAIEEFQHVVHNVPVKDQQAVADIIKHLMEVERITVILSGIETLLPFLALDPQLDRRISKVPFHRLTPADLDKIADMVHAYVQEAGLQIAYSDDDVLFPRLIHASLHAWGLSIENTIAAIALCKQQGDATLTKEHFASVYAAKTGKAAPENPFIADRWHEIVCKTAVNEADPAGPPVATERGKDRQ